MLYRRQKETGLAAEALAKAEGLRQGFCFSGLLRNVL
jgi:hypothetical protein